jgi:small-conductance mechanosensitive channel
VKVSSGVLGEEGPLIVRSLLHLRDQVAARLPYIAIGLFIVLALFVGGKVAKKLIRAAGNHTQLDPMLADLLGTVASGVFTLLGILIAMVVVFPTFRPGDVIAGLGITSVALGFAFKDILQNWLAGIFLLWRRPFRIGDQIRSGEHEGTVEEIRVRSTLLKTYAGERVVLPNSDVYTRAIIVRTAFSSRRVSLQIGIGYEDDMDAAREVMRRVLRSTEGVMQNPSPWAYVNELAPSFINVMIYFWTEPQQANVLQVTDRVASSLTKDLDEAGFAIAYPHQVVRIDDRAPYKKPPTHEEDSSRPPMQ